MAFDIHSMTLSGTPLPVADNLERGAASGAMYFAASRSGLMVSAPTGERHRLVWVDRSGRESSISDDERAFRGPVSFTGWQDGRCRGQRRNTPFRHLVIRRNARYPDSPDDERSQSASGMDAGRLRRSCDRCRHHRVAAFRRADDDRQRRIAKRCPQGRHCALRAIGGSRRRAARASKFQRYLAFHESGEVGTVARS